MNKNYILLDNWIFKLISDTFVKQSLISYINSNNFTVALTTAGLTELYNPGEVTSNSPDRVERATEFLGQVPCAIVDPADIFKEEARNHWRPLSNIPIRLDLTPIHSVERSQLLRQVLRRDPVFVNMGHDIAAWAEGVKHLKSKWLEDVNNIIDKSIEDGFLKRSKFGKIMPSGDAGREYFLYSLDGRFVDEGKVDHLLENHARWRRQARDDWITSTRLCSLLIMHAYTDIDSANKIKKQGSDISDIYHLSLAPYLRVITTDKNMFRLFRSIPRRGGLKNCKIMTEQILRAKINAAE